MRIGSFRVFELIWEAPGDEKGNLMGWSGAFVSEAKSNSLEVLLFCCRVGELEDIWNLSFNQRFSSVQLQSIIHIHLHNHIQYTWWNMITVWHAKSVSKLKLQPGVADMATNKRTQWTFYSLATWSCNEARFGRSWPQKLNHGCRSSSNMLQKSRWPKWRYKIMRVSIHMQSNKHDCKFNIVYFRVTGR